MYLVQCSKGNECIFSPQCMLCISHVVIQIANELLLYFCIVLKVFPESKTLVILQKYGSFFTTLRGFVAILLFILEKKKSHTSKQNLEVVWPYFVCMENIIVQQSQKLDGRSAVIESNDQCADFTYK